MRRIHYRSNTTIGIPQRRRLDDAAPYLSYQRDFISDPFGVLELLQQIDARSLHVFQLIEPFTRNFGPPFAQFAGGPMR